VEHFGDQWAPFCELKRRYDPDSILNPGFIPFPEAGAAGTAGTARPKASG
jgi:hypothetical protein